MRVYDRCEWDAALVVVEQGAIELECSLGIAYRFRSGDVLVLGGLPLRALHNRGPEPAVLSAVQTGGCRGTGPYATGFMIRAVNKGDYV